MYPEGVLLALYPQMRSTEVSLQLHRVSLRERYRILYVPMLLSVVCHSTLLVPMMHGPRRYQRSIKLREKIKSGQQQNKLNDSNLPQ